MKNSALSKTHTPVNKRFAVGPLDQSGASTPLECRDIVTAFRQGYNPKVSKPIGTVQP
jgi:hypothetical protein